VTRRRWPLSLGELFFVAAGPICIIIASYAAFTGLVHGLTSEILLVLGVSWVAWPFITWVMGRTEPEKPSDPDSEN
jgi:hypothetical protein